MRNSFIEIYQFFIRATAFIGMYRVLRLGWDREKAFEDAHKIWKVEEYPVWEHFLSTMLTR